MKHTIFIFIFFVLNTAEAQDLNKDLQGWYSFSNSLLDQSHRKITGIGNQIVSDIGIDGNVSSCYSFNGTSSFIDLG